MKDKNKFGLGERREEGEEEFSSTLGREGRREGGLTRFCCCH